MYIMFDVTLHHRMFTTATTVQYDVYVDFVRSYVEVVKSLSVVTISTIVFYLVANCTKPECPEVMHIHVRRSYYVVG